MNLQIGSTVGDYEVVGILGAGGMGKVYKVRNTISDRMEAMKVLLPDLANAPDLADRFLREIKVQASLEHPNIAALHTAVRVDNQLLMLMEFVDGVTLDHKLKDGGLPVPQVLDYIMQVLAALDYAHQRGVIHRDIKPANMMLTPTGRVKLMDFGIAKASSDRKLTVTGTTMGSLYYMSPEQIRGAETLDSRSDLYSVGVSLYELVTARHPFDGDSQFAIMSAHLEKVPVPPVVLDPHLPKALNDIILMSISRDPNQRFQTAAAFRNAVGGVQAVLAIPAPAIAPAISAEAPRSVPAAEPPKPHARRGLWIAIGALAAVAGVICVIQFSPRRGIKAAAPAAPVTAPVPAATAPPTIPAPAPEQPVPPPMPAAVEARQPAPSASQPKQAPIPSPPAAVPTRASEPRPQTPAPAEPAAQQSQPAVQVQAPPPKAVSSGPSREEVQAARERYMMLNVRASGIRTSLQTLQRSQAASGLNLRGDMQEASGLMDSYLGFASSALNASDTVSAKAYMDKAEPQIEKLEKFLNR